MTDFFLAVYSSERGGTHEFLLLYVDSGAAAPVRAFWCHDFAADGWGVGAFHQVGSLRQTGRRTGRV